MLMLRKVQFYEVARAEGIYRSGDLRQMKLNHRPTCGWQHQYGEAPGAQVLLIAQVLIGGDAGRSLSLALGGSQTLFGMAQDHLHLFAGHAGEPFEEIIHPRPIFQVLEERLNRHPCAPEKPGAAYFPRCPFDCRTLTPIKHTGKLYPQPRTGKFALLSQNAQGVSGQPRGLLPAPEPASRHGKDAFHRVPFVPGEVRDAVERVLTRFRAREFSGRAPGWRCAAAIPVVVFLATQDAPRTGTRCS